MNQPVLTPEPFVTDAPSAPPVAPNAYLVFPDEFEAGQALEVIYANMVSSVQSPDLLDVTTGQEVPIAEVTPEDAVQYEASNRRFPVFGVNAASGIKETKQGYTTAWAEALQTVQGTWVFPKPDDALMAGVEGFTVEPYDPAWFPEAPVEAQNG